MKISDILVKLRDNSNKLKLLWWGILGLTVLLNLFIHPHNPHFEWEKIPGAWGIFGFICSISVILIMKKVIYPLISRPEGYYEC